MRVMSRFSRAKWSGIVATCVSVTVGVLPFYGCLGSMEEGFEQRSSGLAVAFAVGASVESLSELGVSRWEFEIEGVDTQRPSGVYSAYDAADTLLFQISEQVEDAEQGTASWWLDGAPVQTAAQREELVRLVAFAHTDVTQEGVAVPYRGDCSSEWWNFVAADAALGAAMLSVAFCATGIGCLIAGAGLASAAAWLKSAELALDTCTETTRADQ